MIRFGIDPRSSASYRFFQTVTIAMEFDPVVEPGKHDWAEKRALAFPQFLKGDDNIPYLFNGKKFVPNGNCWQICDITDPLLQSIISDVQPRSEFSWDDGFFWNGTMAKLEVFMRDKLTVIRDGGIPDDQDYRHLLAFPDKYISPKKKWDYTRYGLEFGLSYTVKEVFLRCQLLKRAKATENRT